MVTSHLTGEAVTREKISQWMDGEGDEEAENSVRSFVNETLKSEAGRDAWALYHHIGDVLRDGAQCGSLSTGFTARVMQALEAEPTVLSPRAATALYGTEPAKRRLGYRIWALAATMAGVAIIGWEVASLRNDAGIPMGGVGSLETAGVPVVVAELPELTLPADVFVPETLCKHVREALVPIDYLLTHQEFLPSAAMWPGINVYHW